MPAVSRLPATRRINHGRGHRYLLDGEEVDGVTRILEDGLPAPALIAWAANTTAAYAVDHWQDLEGLGVAERLKRLERARYEVRDAAANRGTQVHHLAHLLAQGQAVEVPEELTAHVDAYLQFVADWQPEELLAEVVVVSRTYRYMGTLDVIARLLDGFTWLLDFKTSGKGIYPKTALQAAAYLNADGYLDADGVQHELPPVHRAGAVWIRDDGYDLIPVDAGPETFRTFLNAQRVAACTQAPIDRYVLPALRPEQREAS